MTVFERVSTARREYRCDAGFLCRRSNGTVGNVIDAGERYSRQTVAPWTLTSDDAESPPFPVGEWLTMRYHVECDPRGWY
jgi:hypothetical protein